MAALRAPAGQALPRGGGQDAEWQQLERPRDLPGGGGAHGEGGLGHRGGPALTCPPPQPAGPDLCPAPMPAALPQPAAPDPCPAPTPSGPDPQPCSDPPPRPRPADPHPCPAPMPTLPAGPDLVFCAHASGSGPTARCPTSPGSSWFRALCPTPAWCRRRGRCCAPRDTPGSGSPSPRGPPRSRGASACRWGPGRPLGWRRRPGAEVTAGAACVLQVVHVGSRALQALLGEPEAASSPLLCLSQSSPSSFLRPVTVQLPLPPGVTGEGSGAARAGAAIGRGAPARGLRRCTLPGLSLDRARLHLLHRAAPAAAWDDVTAQVALELTHLYARFRVTRFSWSVPPPPRPPPHSRPPACRVPLTPAFPGTGSGTPPRPAWGAWRRRPGSGCGCTA